MRVLRTFLDSFNINFWMAAKFLLSFKSIDSASSVITYILCAAYIICDASPMFLKISKFRSSSADFRSFGFNIKSSFSNCFISGLLFENLLSILLSKLKLVQILLMYFYFPSPSRNRKSRSLGYPSISNILISWSFSLRYELFMSVFFEHGEIG